MNTFPHIKHLSDLLPLVEGNSQIRVKPDEDTGFTIVSYMVQDEDTFTGVNEAAERECRGITFDLEGNIVSRTLHKFFNVGQREDVQPENIQWSKVVRIMDKRDGSMVTPVLVGGDTYEHVRWKTKKTFSSKEAQLAGEVATKTPRGLEWVTGVLHAGYTPTFEITSPRYPIVLKYETDELTLLHVRANDTGEYVNPGLLSSLFGVCPFPIVENLIEEFYGEGVPQRLVSWEKLKLAAETREGIEGWIVQFEGGEMVKVKTKWYCELHHAVTFTRWRDVARAVVADQSDDLKGAFAMTGRSIEPILEAERRIFGRISEVQNAVELHVGNGRVLNRTAKDMALALRDHELFGLIMALFRDKEPDYMAWYVKNHLDNDFSLEVVGD